MLLDTGEWFPAKISGPKNKHYKYEVMFGNDESDKARLPVPTDRACLAAGTLVEVKQDDGKWLQGSLVLHVLLCLSRVHFLSFCVHKCEHTFFIDTDACLHPRIRILYSGWATQQDQISHIFRSRISRRAGSRLAQSSNPSASASIRLPAKVIWPPSSSRAALCRT